MEIRKKILSVSAIIAALSVFFSTGFALGNQNAASRVSALPEASTDRAITAAVSEWTDPTPPTFESGTQTEEAIEPETEQQTAAATTPAETDEAKNLHPVTAIPSTAGEAVELFNAAANRIKTDKPTVYQTKDRFQISEALFGKTNISALLSKMNRDDSSKKEILPVEFPVGGETWASKLQLDAVQSAECVDAGDTLQIKITLKPESGVPLRSQSNHGSCFSIPGDFDFLNFDISGIKIGELTLTYSGCSISCSIEKSTGRLLNADYHIQAKGSVQLTLAAILKKECSATIISDTSYTTAWE